MIKLYGYWRSSAAYRVRIALHLKSIPFESIAVHLIKSGGEQHQQDYTALNPNHLVPTLIDGDLVLNQSIAIIDYLDAQYPQTPLYPSDIKQKVVVQALALDIACEMHPINNLRVQQYLSNELKVDAQAKTDWIVHWMNKGFTALENQLEKTSGKFCFADDVSIADLCLIPQVYNAKRFGVDMGIFNHINRIVDNCQQLSAFDLALPENQPDAQ